MMAGRDGLPMKRTNDSEEVDLGNIQMKNGNNRIRFTCIKNPNVKYRLFLIPPEKLSLKQ